jgi:hypothetical protein
MTISMDGTDLLVNLFQGLLNLILIQIPKQSPIEWPFI